MRPFMKESPDRTRFRPAAVSTTLLLICCSIARAADSDRRELWVDDPRPVARAVEELVQRYEYTITYEDPRYEYAGDIKDVTEEVRRDLHKFAAGKAPRVLVPFGGTLNISYSVSRLSERPENPSELIDQVLSAYAEFAGERVFRLEQDDKFIHVIPNKIRNGSGEWVEQGSILDGRITISVKERSLEEMLQEICTAVSAEQRVRVAIGSAPHLSWGADRAVGATGESARTVLLRTLNSSGRQVVWQIFYGPDIKAYFLNLRALPHRDESLKPRPAPPAKPGAPTPSSPREPGVH